MTGKPQPIGDVLAQLMARRGYARQQSGAASLEAWREAAGDVLANLTRPGLVKRGVLEVFVANSTLMQEMSFQKATLTAKISSLLPDEKIRDLKFKVGPIK